MQLPDRRHPVPGRPASRCTWSGPCRCPTASRVPTDVTFRLTFDDYPDPDTVRSDSILLTTGFFWVPGSYGVDLIDKAAVMRPIRPLSPGLGYSLHLRPALSSLAGCPGSSEEIEFITGDGPAGDAAATAGDVRRPFRRSSTPAARAPAATWRRRTRRWLPGGPGGGPVAVRAGGLGRSWSASPRAQDDQLQLVEAGRLGAQLSAAQAAAGDRRSGGPIAGVYGQREPPGEPLPEDQLRAIAAWIDGGALR